MLKRVFMAASLAAFMVAPAAYAQQSADEPFLDPIFGERPKRSQDQEIRPMNDDEFDEPQGWSPFRGFVGLFTLLVPESTNLSLGVGPAYRPDYFGSDDYEFRPDPQVFLKVKNFLFFDDDGADLALFGFSGVAIGPSVRVAGRRRERDNPALHGLGDIGYTFEAGGFVAATILNRVLVRGKIRKGLAGGHDGLIIDGAGTVMLYSSPRFSTSLSGHVAWVNGDYADTFFTVNEDQAAASGLPLYNASAGFRDVGGSLNAYVNIGERWSVNPYVSYRRIFDGFAETPIIDQYGSRNQFIVGFHLMREFSFSFIN